MLMFVYLANFSEQSFELTRVHRSLRHYRSRLSATFPSGVAARFTLHKRPPVNVVFPVYSRPVMQFILSNNVIRNVFDDPMTDVTSENVDKE